MSTQDLPYEDAVCEGLDCKKEEASKPKRDLIRFNSEKPTVINLEHVTHIELEGTKIKFNFPSTAIYIDMQDETAALNAFDSIINIWSPVL